jgi:hypothetical protein
VRGPLNIERRGVHFQIRDNASRDRQATIDSLRLEIPVKGLEDICRRRHKLELQRLQRENGLSKKKGL